MQKGVAGGLQQFLQVR